MKLAILQPNYIPWRGYFDLIAHADILVLYDDVQYTKDDWRNRNRLLGPQGPFWLTIPVQKKGLFGQKINEAKIQGPQWQKKHWRSIEVNYHKAKYFSLYAEDLKVLYEQEYTYLVEVQRTFIEKIMVWLNLRTRLLNSSDFKYEGETASARVLSICKLLNATEYLSGPAAKDYLDEKLFDDQDIQIKYFDYSGYKNYPRVFPGYEAENLSILDLLLNCGPQAMAYMKWGTTICEK